VLSDINLKVEKGEFIAIMGQSCSGKSTFLYTISEMDRPTSGNVLLCDNDISKLSDDKMSEVRLKQLGFIFQHPYLLKKISIRDNIILPGFKVGTLSREQVNQNAYELMTKTGIDSVVQLSSLLLTMQKWHLGQVELYSLWMEISMMNYEVEEVNKLSREKRLYEWLEEQEF